MQLALQTGPVPRLSDEHSSLVAKVRHLRTQCVSPQFHVVFNDLFEMVNNPVPLDETKAGAILDEHFNKSQDSYVDLEHDGDGAIVFTNLLRRMTFGSARRSDATSKSYSRNTGTVHATAGCDISTGASQTAAEGRPYQLPHRNAHIVTS